MVATTRIARHYLTLAPTSIYAARESVERSPQLAELSRAGAAARGGQRAQLASMALDERTVQTGPRRGRMSPHRQARQAPAKRRGRRVASRQGPKRAHGHAELGEGKRSASSGGWQRRRVDERRS